MAPAQELPGIGTRTHHITEAEGWVVGGHILGCFGVNLQNIAVIQIGDKLLRSFDQGLTEGFFERIPLAKIAFRFKGHHMIEIECALPFRSTRRVENP